MRVTDRSASSVQVLARVAVSDVAGVADVAVLLAFAAAVRSVATAWERSGRTLKQRMP